MEDGIKRERVEIIFKKLDECKVQLLRKNIFSCITLFREVLEKTLATPMLASDKKALTQKINEYQTSLSQAQAFKDIYGPVAFRDNDIQTALAFLKQLIHIKEEEISSPLQDSQDIDKPPSGNALKGEVFDARIKEIQLLIEKGQLSEARELIGKDEEIASHLMQSYNDQGIAFRKQGLLDKAIQAFRNAIFLEPEDEGLHYNLSRVYIEKGEWIQARDAIVTGLRINPDFPAGKTLMQYIQKHIS
ncbi:MAG: tetratricopeptide repeat protein [Desulfobacterales bacterium]